MLPSYEGRDGNTIHALQWLGSFKCIINIFYFVIIRIWSAAHVGTIHALQWLGSLSVLLLYFNSLLSVFGRPLMWAISMSWSSDHQLSQFIFVRFDSLVGLNRELKLKTKNVPMKWLQVSIQTVKTNRSRISGLTYCSWMGISGSISVDQLSTGMVACTSSFSLFSHHHLWPSCTWHSKHSNHCQYNLSYHILPVGHMVQCWHPYHSW